MKSSFLLIFLCPLLLSGCGKDKQSKTSAFINKSIKEIDYKTVSSTMTESTVFSLDGSKIYKKLEERKIEANQGVIQTSIEKIPPFGTNNEETKVEYVALDDKASFFDLGLSRFLIDSKLYKKEITSLNNHFTFTALEGAIITIDGVEGKLKTSTYHILDRAISGLEIEYGLGEYNYKLKYGIER